MVRAVLEGVVFEIRSIIETWKQAGHPVERIRIAGGATRSDLWNQIQADIYGVEVSKPECDEASCLGAAILAGVGTGVWNSVAEACSSMTREGKTYTPRPDVADAYDEAWRDFVAWADCAGRNNGR